MDFDECTNSFPSELGPAWRKLPRPLQELLWHGGWRSAVQLEAAFDDERGAMQLVEHLEGNCEISVTNRAWAKALVEWQAQVAGEVRRLRRRMADPDLEYKAVTLQNFQRQLEQRPLASVLKLAKAYFLETHWRTRKARKVSLAVTAESRTAVEAAEKVRWTLKIIGVLKESDTPVCQQAAMASDPEAALMSVVGRRRSRTLRSRYKVWAKIRLWLSCVFWPQLASTHWRHVGLPAGPGFGPNGKIHSGRSRRSTGFLREHFRFPGIAVDFAVDSVEEQFGKPGNAAAG